MSHLNEKTAKIASLSASERKLYIETEEIWIPYDRAKEILKRLQTSLDREGSRRDHLAIVAHTGNGKTYTINEFLKRARKKYLEKHPDKSFPVIRIQQPPQPSEGRLYTALLVATNSPHRASDNVARKFAQVVKVLSGGGIKMIVIDDLHDGFKGQDLAKRQYLAVLRHLMESTGVTIVMAGVETVLEYLDYDEQIRRRVDVIELPRWNPDVQFRRLLASFEEQIPLRRKSNLANPGLSSLICSLGEGLLFPIWKLLEKASMYAIDSGKECIDEEVIRECGWVRVSDKMKAAGKRLN